MIWYLRVVWNIAVLQIARLLKVALTSVKEPAPSTVKDAPLAVESAPVVLESAPAVVESASLVVESAPLVVEDAPVCSSKANGPEHDQSPKRPPIPADLGKKLPVTQSEEYYFPNEDLVIQVEETLFRVHRSTLVLHSEFFRDMFTLPPSKDQDGTSDERPLRLPQRLCSAEAFTTLCKLIFPKVMGVFPPVLVKDFEQWEPVLEATETLQMFGVQNYILTQIHGKEADFKDNPISLLGWAMCSELTAPLETIRFQCLSVLAYRSRPLSTTEINVLGGKASALVMRIREKIRLFIMDQANTETLKSHIPADPACDRHTYCRNDIYKKILSKLRSAYPSCDPEKEKNDFDIFRLSRDEVPSAAAGCRAQSNLDGITSGLRRGVLDQQVRQCIFECEIQPASVTGTS